MANDDDAVAKAAPPMPAATARAAQQTLGVSGTAILAGQVQTRERNSALVGPARWKTYEDLVRNRVSIASSLRFLGGLVGRVDWKWTPPDDSSRAQQAADLFADATIGTKQKRRGWRRVARALSMHLVKGFAIGEMIAVPRAAGGFGITIEPREQHTMERWVRHPTSGQLLGVIQRDPETGREVPLPRWKLVYTVDDALTSSPEGIGLLRQAVEPAHRLTRYEQLEGYNFETDLRGIPELGAPLGELRQQKALRIGTPVEQVQLASTDPEIANLVTFMNNHVRGADTGILLDTAVYADSEGKPTNVRKFSASLMRGDGGPLPHLHAAIDRLEHALATLFGTQVLRAGANGKGSLALSKQQAQLAILLVESMLEDVKEAVQNDVVPFLGRLNNIPEELWPTPDTSSLEERDVEVVCAALRDLELANLDDEDPAVNEARAMMGVSPRPPRDRERLERDAGLGGGRGRRGGDVEPDGDDLDDDSEGG